MSRPALPLAVLAVALLVVFHRLLLGDVFFWGLPALQFVPWRDYAFDVLRAGDLPLWNPYNGAGAPLFANYQSGLLYPPNWIGMLLPVAWAMSLLAVSHLFLAGWGMWRFTGLLGVASLGRGLSALAFGMTGYLVARLGTYPMIETAAWLPWLLWAAHRLLAGSRRAAAAFALVTGLMLLAGHAQTAWYCLLLVAAYGLWWALRVPIPGLTRATVARRLVALGLLAMLGAGIAALQLAATAELLRSSQRSAGVDYAFAMNFSFAPARVLNLLNPNVFGTPADGSYLVAGLYYEYAVYVGLIPLVSALAALAAWVRARRTPERPPAFVHVPFWGLVVLVAFIFALGEFTPIFPFLYRHVPTFGMFQAPVRWHLWTVFGLSVLAGIGASVWPQGYRARRWMRRALVASLAVVVLALILSFTRAASVEGAVVLIRAMLVTGMLAAVATWLSLRKPDNAHPRYSRWSLLVLLVVAADLVQASWGLNPTVPADFVAPRGTGARLLDRAYWPAAVEEAVRFSTFFRVDDYRIAAERWPEIRSSSLPNLNLLDRRYLLNNFDPLLVGPYAEFIDLLEAAPDPVPLLQAANVAAVYDASGVARPLARPASRAWLVNSACWHENSRSLKDALLQSAWDPFTQVHMLGDAGCPPPPLATSGAALLVADDGNRVEIEVSAPSAGWLVLADVDYPGWHAEVDGEPVPIYRANLAFRAVQVPRGEHRVTFTYWPEWLLPGALISILSLLVALALFALKVPRGNA